MPPRTAPSRERTITDEASIQPQEEALAGRGRGRGRRGRGHGRGRGRHGGMPEVDIPRARRGNPTLAELAANMQNIQQTVQQIANKVIDPGEEPHGEQNQDEDEHSHEVMQEEQAPAHQHDQPPTSTRAVEVSLSAFLKVSPPTFSGSDVQEDPQAFLDDVSWICRDLGCSSTRMVELAAFRLRDVARGWYETMLFARPAGLPSLEWDEFVRRFLAHFLPQSVRDSRAKEFETLVQAENMSVMEYNVQFMRLARYAPHLVATEQHRVQRFIDGLKTYLFRAIAGHGDMTYEEALNRALTIERGNRDRGGTSYDSRKKPRFDSSRGGHQGQGGGGSRGNITQDHQGQQAGFKQQNSQVSQTASSNQGRGTSQHHVSSSMTPVTCITCGKTHTGPCRQRSFRCYQCGQIGHFARNCPTLRTQPSASGVATPVATGRQFTSGIRGSGSSQHGGRGSGGRGQGQDGGGQARVFSLTRQDAQTSNVVVTDSVQATPVVAVEGNGSNLAHSS